MMQLMTDDDVWQTHRSQWALRPGTTYLNHGSFGPPPEPVRRARLHWQELLDNQPMDFFTRAFEPAWLMARRELARFIHAPEDDLVLVENATMAMNMVAGSFPLRPGDEVLLNDHEYGAVLRIWQRACRQVDAREPVVARLPWPVESAEHVVDVLWDEVTDRTRLIVISHITSPTAMIAPVAEVCRRARERGIAVCIDGPHAPAQIPLDVSALGCDFYTASCHKWLSAPFGTGFLYVAPPHQARFAPLQLSWGRLPPAPRDRWWDEFVWSGTRDPSALLTIPAAIHFLESIGLENFRRHGHDLARYSRQRLEAEFGQVAAVPDDPAWYGTMVHVPLPPGDPRRLQQSLWEQHAIEVPIIDFRGQRGIRVSCHIYNTEDDIDHLLDALRQLVEG